MSTRTIFLTAQHSIHFGQLPTKYGVQVWHKFPARFATNVDPYQIGLKCRGIEFAAFQQKRPMTTEEIWLADDDLDDLEIYTDVLSSLKVGGSVRVFRDGAEVIQALSATAGTLPKLLLLDSRMPVVGGLEVVKTLRSQGHHNTPGVFILTTTISPVDKTEASALGVPIIVKPVSLKSIEKMLKNLLAGAALSSALLPASLIFL